MKRYPHSSESRPLRTQKMEADLCIVGGGLSGTCAAITAAREGLSVVLIQDRPVLGGNASSEVRLWALGASSHNHNNNRWAREGGVIDELLVENMRKNKEGNPLLFDAVILEAVVTEPNITLLLNTVVHNVRSRGETLESVIAFSSQTETEFDVHASLFIDASGDGIVAHMLGVPFRIGAEKSDEFDEGFAPDPDTYGELLGHSIFFMTKDTGRPVPFIAPAYALKNAPERIPRFKNFNVNDQGCMFWWIEYGGRLDTIHDTEKIKWELWSIIYGVWDHIKNSGDYPEADTLTLEWMGAIPGKRESRRFEPARWLVQRDIVEQNEHPDAVGYGGWSIDLHPADGIYTARPGCDQYHAKGVYQIPFRTMYNPSFPNLLLAGRIVGSSHVAFGSTRVMATCAHSAQAAAMAAVLSKDLQKSPPAFDRTDISELQRRLQRIGQHIPRMPLRESGNLALQARVTASSELNFFSLPSVPDGEVPLHHDLMQMVPLPAGRIPSIVIPIRAQRATTLEVELRLSLDRWNYTPEQVLHTWQLDITTAGRGTVRIDTDVVLREDCYAYFNFKHNDAVSLIPSAIQCSGVFSLRHTNDQAPPSEWGLHGFEIWTPERRPDGAIVVMRSETALAAPFAIDQLTNGFQRPGYWPNAWVASPDDLAPTVTFSWPEPKDVSRIEIVFDTDYNHPMESVVRGHPESIMPMCVRDYSIHDDRDSTLVQVTGNYRSIRTHQLERSIRTESLQIRIHGMNGRYPAALFDVRVYG